MTREALRRRGLLLASFIIVWDLKALALGDADGQAKVVADARTGEILGVHMVGPDVTELIGEFAIARSLEATPLEVARAVHPHPTLSEVIAEAARAIEGEPIHL